MMIQESKSSSVICTDGVGYDVFLNRDRFAIENVYHEGFAGKDLKSLIKINCVLESVYSFGRNLTPFITEPSKRPIFSSLNFGCIPVAVLKFSGDGLRPVNVVYRGYRTQSAGAPGIQMPVWAIYNNGQRFEFSRSDLMAYHEEGEEPQYSFARNLFYKCALVLVEIPKTDNICLVGAHLCPFKLYNGYMNGSSYVWDSKVGFCDWAIAALEGE